MKRSIPTIAALLCAALPAVLVGVAAAQDPLPQPGCAGVQYTDPAGDTQAAPQGLGVPGTSAPANYDLTGGFFRMDDNKVTANLTIAKLDETNAPGSDGARYYMFFTLGDADSWVRATRTGSEVVYEYGHLEGTQLVTDGNTTGKMFQGDNGVVQIVVPAAMKAVGKTLTNTGGESRATRGASTLYWTDFAPDGGDNTGKPYTVAPCADGGGGTGTQPAPTDPGQTTPPVSPPPPSHRPESNQPGSPPPSGGSTPAALDVRVSAGKQSARKIAKGKRMIVRIRSSKGVTGLKATLKSGRKTVGSGKLAKVKGSAKLTIKVRRKLKPGSYTLSLLGTNAGGTRAAGVVNLRIRK